MQTSILEASYFTGLIDPAGKNSGVQAFICSRIFFAEEKKRLKQGGGIFIEDQYPAPGKWMDGWESRRRSEGGYDWCKIKHYEDSGAARLCVCGKRPILKS